MIVVLIFIYSAYILNLNKKLMQNKKYICYFVFI